MEAKCVMTYLSKVCHDITTVKKQTKSGVITTATITIMANATIPTTIYTTTTTSTHIKLCSVLEMLTNIERDGHKEQTLQTSVVFFYNHVKHFLLWPVW